MASLVVNGTTAVTETSGVLTYTGTISTASKFPKGFKTNLQAYTYTGRTTTSKHSETVWWTCNYTKRYENTSLYIDMATPVHQLPNGVWVGVACRVKNRLTGKEFTASRGYQNTRPQSDTTFTGFKGVYTHEEIGTNTGLFQIEFLYMWGSNVENDGAMQPWERTNFAGGSGTGNDDRIGSDKQTEGMAICMEMF